MEQTAEQILLAEKDDEISRLKQIERKIKTKLIVVTEELESLKTEASMECKSTLSQINSHYPENKAPSNIVEVFNSASNTSRLIHKQKIEKIIRLITEE